MGGPHNRRCNECKQVRSTASSDGKSWPAICGASYNDDCCYTCKVRKLVPGNWSNDKRQAKHSLRWSATRVAWMALALAQNPDFRIGREWWRQIRDQPFRPWGFTYGSGLGS